MDEKLHFANFHPETKNTTKQNKTKQNQMKVIIGDKYKIYVCIQISTLHWMKSTFCKFSCMTTRNKWNVIVMYVCFFLLSGVHFKQMIKDTKIRKTDKSR